MVANQLILRWGETGIIQVDAMSSQGSLEVEEGDRRGE